MAVESDSLEVDGEADVVVLVAVRFFRGRPLFGGRGFDVKDAASERLVEDLLVVVEVVRFGASLSAKFGEDKGCA